MPAERVADVFVEVADTLVDLFDLIEFLQMVTSRSSELVDAAAAGLLLADQQGDLQFMAASDESTRLLELFQLQNRQGPLHRHSSRPAASPSPSGLAARAVLVA